MPEQLEVGAAWMPVDRPLDDGEKPLLPGDQPPAQPLLSLLGTDGVPQRARQIARETRQHGGILTARAEPARDRVEAEGRVRDLRPGLRHRSVLPQARSAAVLLIDDAGDPQAVAEGDGGDGHHRPAGPALDLVGEDGDPGGFADLLEHGGGGVGVHRGAPCTRAQDGR